MSSLAHYCLYSGDGMLSEAPLDSKVVFHALEMGLYMRMTGVPPGWSSVVLHPHLHIGAGSLTCTWLALGPRHLDHATGSDGIDEYRLIPCLPYADVPTMAKEHKCG